MTTPSTVATTSEPGATAPGSRSFDLDAARAARAEALGEAPTVTFGGQQFVLPVEMPLDVAMYAKDGEFRLCMAALLGDQADAFLALRPSIEDVRELVQALASIYGVSQGEAPASPNS